MHGTLRARTAHISTSGRAQQHPRIAARTLLQVVANALRLVVGGNLCQPGHVHERQSRHVGRADGEHYRFAAHALSAAQRPVRLRLNLLAHSLQMRCEVNEGRVSISERITQTRSHICAGADVDGAPLLVQKGGGFHQRAAGATRRRAHKLQHERPARADASTSRETVSSDDCL